MEDKVAWNGKESKPEVVLKWRFKISCKGLEYAPITIGTKLILTSVFGKFGWINLLTGIDFQWLANKTSIYFKTTISGV